MSTTTSIAIACQDLKFDNISAIIFDKDGTLENSLEFWRGVGVERARLIDAQIPGVGEPLLMAFGILDNVLEPNGLMAVGSRQENEIAAAAYIAETGRDWYEARKIAQEAFAQVSESKYMAKTIDTAPVFPQVKETLAALASSGVKIAILSNDSTKGVEDFVKNHQLQEYIQLCMGSDNQIFKPDAQLYLQACQALKVTPQQTLMIGDSTADMLMAKNAGASGTLGICYHQNSKLTHADTHISSLGEIQIW